MPARQRAKQIDCSPDLRSTRRSRQWVMDGARNGSDPSASGAGSKGPRVPPPPVVAPRPAGETTVVTRHPRAKSTGPAEPHELLPTLRLPPVDAGAMRAQVQAKAREAAARREAERTASGDAAVTNLDADGSRDDTAARDGGDADAREATLDATSPAAAAADVVAPQTAPPSETVEDPEAQRREHAPTIRVQSLQAAGLVAAAEANAPGSRLAAMPRHPGVKRKPLPLPDVLRQGPKTPSRASSAMPPAAEPAAPHAPEPVVEIDTASLVVDIASALAPPEPPPPPAPITFEPPQRPPEQRDAAPVLAVSSDSVATALPRAHTVTSAVTIAVAPRRSRRGLLVAAIGVAAIAAIAAFALRGREPTPTPMVAASAPAAEPAIEAAAREVVAEAAQQPA
ncbi:MAG: hypothetical protein K1X88_36270, partial [Nannocystaceae bacterium]|nr:hypothetical protein [Nannocystaceae bacterium]